MFVSARLNGEDAVYRPNGRPDVLQMPVTIDDIWR
jgi:hypothetical protein